MSDERLSNRLELRFMGLILLIGVGLWWPATRDIKRLEADVVSTQRRLTGVDGQAGAIMELSMDVQSMRQTLANESRVIPRERDLGTLLRSVTNRLEELGMTDLQISTPKASPHEGYVAQPINVRFAGYAMEVFEWVQHVEWLPRLVQFKRMSLRYDEPSGLVHADVMLETYYYTDGEGSR
ncbi:MAG: type 4a pilus biogenesis protein PilO [Planctomycetota bacterium]|jgi:Tfp pilus assembly protein PilO